MTLFIFFISFIIAFVLAFFLLKPTYNESSWKKELDGFELDTENVEKIKNFVLKYSKTPIAFLANFTTKQGREKLSIKERWLTYAIYAGIALVAGLGFYLVAITIGVLIFIFKKLKQYKVATEENQDEITTEATEENQDEIATEATEEEPQWLYYKVRNYVKDLFARVKDEKGELIIEEYIGLLMISSLPFSIAQFLIPQYNTGWLMVGLVLLTLFFVYLVELLTGFKFTKLGELKDIKKILEEHKKKTTELKTALKQVQDELKDVQQKLDGEEMAHELLIEHVLDIAGMSKYKAEVKPALEDLKAQLGKKKNSEGGSNMTI